MAFSGSIFFKARDPAWAPAQESLIEMNALLHVLAAILEDKIHRASLIAASSPQIITKLHGIAPPMSSIEQFLQQINIIFAPERAQFICAMINLEHYLHQTSIPLTKLNVHRLVITSFMLSQKVLLDKPYQNVSFAQFARISRAEMNGMEVEFLLGINFDVWCSAEHIESYERFYQLDQRVANSRGVAAAAVINNLYRYR